MKASRASQGSSPLSDSVNENGGALQYGCAGDFSPPSRDSLVAVALARWGDGHRAGCLN